MKKNIAWDVIDNFQITVHSKDPPSHEEWLAYIEHAKSLTPRGVLVYSEGGAPTALQRKMLRDNIESTTRESRVAILTRSVAMRLAITALNLFFDNRLKVFESHEVKEALRYIQAPEELWPALQKRMEALFVTLL